ncbi:hypothetical protein C6366_12660 [Desulfonatronum sp. SC1]|nr:hypothetical protein C6366_12660 [Desulfonatronum sp. SC1]
MARCFFIHGPLFWYSVLIKIKIAIEIEIGKSRASPRDDAIFLDMAFDYDFDADPDSGRGSKTNLPWAESLWACLQAHPAVNLAVMAQHDSFPLHPSSRRPGILSGKRRKPFDVGF